MNMGGPVDARGRIGELDIIRGFALFGVLWMNMFEMPGSLLPEDAVIHLVPKSVDTVVGFFSTWLAIGKAQALFSLLFGFGFALFLDRAENARRDGASLYLRRVGFLFVLGVIHVLFLWQGDILNAYAMMGLLLVFTRRWPGWLLLVVGLSLALLSTTIDRLIWEHLIASPGTPTPLQVLMEPGAVRRLPIFLGHDYAAFVRENWRVTTAETYFLSAGLTYLGWILGRFLIGAWLFRQGWVQNAARHIAGFRRWAAILITVGLALAAIRPVLGALSIKPVGDWQRIPVAVAFLASMIVLGLGYAAGLVVLCQNERWRRRLAGFGAAGRMALTNYLLQSLLYFFFLYGFGAGLLRYTAPTFCLIVAVVFFSAQIAFSQWWLAHYRFGPVEWLWRSWTYGRRQALRIDRPDTAVTAL